MTTADFQHIPLDLHDTAGTEEDEDYYNDDCGDEFVGYNEWAIAALGVELYTDFVYDYGDDHGERGVFVAEDIAPQTRVVSVPFPSLFTLEWILEQADRGHPVYSRVPLFRSLLEQPRSAWDPDHEDDLLAMALVYERFGARERSQWYPHVQLLPKSYDNLLFFSDRELRALTGSNVFFIAQEMQRKVQADYDRLCESTIPSIIQAASTIALDRSSGHRDEYQQLREWFSLEAYQWALSTIWSRFVSLRMDGTAASSLDDPDTKQDEEIPKLKAMAPVFDMLNHDPLAEVSHGYNATTHTLDVVTHQHVSAGTQLCIHYGALSNHKLLTLYGFVVDHNPYDSIELWMPLDPATTPLFHAKVQALFELGIDHESTAFELTCNQDDEIDATLLLTARVAALECGNEQELLACVAQIKYGEIVSCENEVRALSSLIYTLEKALAQYNETPRDRDGDEEEEEEDSKDEEAAVEKEMATVHARHLWMAKTVCESDCLILRKSIEVLKGLLWRVLPHVQTNKDHATLETRG